MFRFFEDPYSGYVEVPVTMLNLMGIADKISSYSYRKDNMAYLEEECDFAVFYDAFVEAYGVAPRYERVYIERNPIRQYEQYA